MVSPMAKFACSELLGVAPDNPLRWELPAVFPAVAVLSLGWAWWLRARRNDAYEAVGLGPDAVRIPPPRTAGDEASATTFTTGTGAAR